MTMPSASPPPTARRGRPPSGGREAILTAVLALLRERGAGRLTTREVARRAQVSEGSIFYHFTDRLGLITAAIENGLPTVLPLDDDRLAGEPLADLLSHFMQAVESFLDDSLMAVIAAQADEEVRSALLDHLRSTDMGPHRGVTALAGHLRDRQAQGAIRADVDPGTIAVYVYGACFERATRRQLISAPDDERSDRQALVTTMVTLLSPVPRP